MQFLITLSSCWIFLIEIVYCDLSISYNLDDWPRHLIKFQGEGNLKDIYDSGIRPFRFPSLEKTCLDFKHSKIIFELNSGERTQEIIVEYGEISPLLGGLLSNIELTSPKLTVEQAEPQMIPFLVKGKRSKEQLTKFLSLVKRDPRNYQDPYDDDPDDFTITWNDVEGLVCYVGFKGTSDPKTPIRFLFGISWESPIRTPRQQRSFYDIPIPPPPGYETVSMDAPRNFGPDSAVEIARSKGLPITGDRTPEEYKKQWREANDKTRAPKTKMLATAPTPSFAASPKPWVWLIVIFGFATAVWLVWRWKLKSFF